MKHTHRTYVRLGFLLMAISVIQGAVGSHILRDMIGEYELAIWEKGVFYQIIHSVSIIVLSLFHRRFNNKIIDFTISLFFFGIAIFSGSLYLLATLPIWGDESFKILGAVTPIGGLAFIIGWLLLFFRGFEEEFSITSEGTESSHSGKHRKVRYRKRRSKHKETDNQA